MQHNKLACFHCPVYLRSDALNTFPFVRVRCNLKLVQTLHDIRSGSDEMLCTASRGAYYESTTPVHQYHDDDLDVGMEGRDLLVVSIQR